MGLQITDKYKEHMTESAIIVKCTTIMWDVPIIRDRKILANRTDRVFKKKKKKETCLLFDIATPDDSDFNTEEIEKLRKQKDLEIEISRM